MNIFDTAVTFSGLSPLFIT